MNQKLIYGDCRVALASLPENSVHLVLTDPPYFLDGLDNNWQKGKDKPSSNSTVSMPSGMKFDPRQGKYLQEFIQNVASEIKRVLVPGGFILCFSQPRLSHRMAIGIEDAGFEIRDIYAWHYTQRSQMKAFSQNHFVDKMNISDDEKDKIKDNLQGRKTPQLRPLYESIIMAQNPKEGTFVNNWVKYQAGLIDTSKTLNNNIPSTVMTVEKPSKDERLHSHLTPKPIKLLSHLIEVFTIEGQTILDPFVGSGSTMVAANNVNRESIGIEIDPEYIQIAKDRL